MIARRVRRSLSWAAAGPRAALVLMSVAAISAACARPSPHVLHLTAEWSSAPASGRESLTTLRLTDDGGRPVTGARLTAQAFMSHPGMAPALVTLDEQGAGLYRARLTFSMAGDWVLRVTGTLQDGQAVDLGVDVPRVRPPE